MIALITRISTIFTSTMELDIHISDTSVSINTHKNPSCQIVLDTLQEKSSVSGEAPFSTTNTVKEQSAICRTMSNCFFDVSITALEELLRDFVKGCEKPNIFDDNHTPCFIETFWDKKANLTDITPSVLKEYLTEKGLRVCNDCTLESRGLVFTGQPYEFNNTVLCFYLIDLKAQILRRGEIKLVQDPINHQKLIERTFLRKNMAVIVKTSFIVNYPKGDYVVPAELYLSNPLPFDTPLDQCKSAKVYSYGKNDASLASEDDSQEQQATHPKQVSSPEDPDQTKLKKTGRVKIPQYLVNPNLNHQYRQSHLHFMRNQKYHQLIPQLLQANQKHC